MHPRLDARRGEMKLFSAQHIQRFLSLTAKP
jgi:hypothetical protein